MLDPESDIAEPLANAIRNHQKNLAAPLDGGATRALRRGGQGTGFPRPSVSSKLPSACTTTP